jgi:hypothetical protein
MSAEWAARPSQPIQPTSTNRKTLFATVNHSLLHFTLDIKAQMNTFTIIWCLKVAHGTERVNMIKDFKRCPFRFQALEEEFSRQLNEQERFYGGILSEPHNYGYNTDSMPRPTSGNKASRLSTAM